MSQILPQTGAKFNLLPHYVRFLFDRLWYLMRVNLDTIYLIKNAYYSTLEVIDIDSALCNEQLRSVTLLSGVNLESLSLVAGFRY